MGTRRTVYLAFDEDDIDLEVNFGTYALMLYYAKQINEEKAKLLFDSTISEYSYRVIYDLSLGTLTYDDFEAHFNIAEIQEVISFIENDLSIALKNESEDLIDKYGGSTGFYNLFRREKGFLSEIILYDEFYYSHPLGINAGLQALKSLLFHAVSINQPYTVNIH